MTITKSQLPLTKPLPLSTFIIAKNEADRLGRALNSLQQLADEIIVLLDDSTTDNTREVCRRYKVKVIDHHWQGLEQAKSSGESKCKHSWILNLNADEEVTPPLAKEIIELFQNDRLEQHYAYRIAIRDVLPFEPPQANAFASSQIRLYNKTKCGFQNDSVAHDTVIIPGTKDSSITERIYVGQLKHDIRNHSMRSLDEWLDKINQRSKIEAAADFAAGKHVGLHKLILAPLLDFMRAFCLRRYFIYGNRGFIYARLYAFSNFSRLLRIYNLQQESKAAKRNDS